MATTQLSLDDPLARLNRAFLLNHPRTAARSLESSAPDDAADILCQQEAFIAARVLEKISPGTLDIIFLLLPADFAASVLVIMEASTAVALQAARVRTCKNSILPR